MSEINEIVVVGGGPVGSYIAVLTSMFGLATTVYEKRTSYSRKINVKIEEKIFEETDKIVNKLGISDNFFHLLNQKLHEKNRRILICELETLIKDKAVLIGAKYVNEEIENFKSVYERHRLNNPIILDCSGRKSKLRNSEFGADEFSMEIIPLESALHINFRALFDKLDKSLLYSAMKNNENIKLSEIVTSRTKSLDGYKNVTIPVFISHNLAELFDLEYPNTSKEPLAPFRPANKNIPSEIFKTISSILGPLMLENWQIDFKSIEVKKIEITCGYSKKRSKANFVCLGDSAVHLAYYKSLNFGLKHALDFFITLSNHLLVSKEPSLYYEDEFILSEFKRLHFNLNPIYVKRTKSANTYLIITKLMLNGVYKFCITNNETEQLTSNLGVRESSVDNFLKQLNENLSDWNYLLEEFETKRSRDIQQVIESNRRKKKMFDYVSDFIWLNGKSPIKISEILSRLVYGYALFKEDHEFLNKCLIILRKSFTIEKCQELEKNFDEQIKNLLELYSLKMNKNDFLNELRNEFEKEKNLVKKTDIFRELIKTKSVNLMHNGDVKFIFVIKCMNIIVEYLDDLE